MLVGDVRDRVCILIDDMLDTSFTLTKAAKLLHENGATKIYALVTHGVMSGDALDRIEKSYLDKVIVSDSVPKNIRVNAPKSPHLLLPHCLQKPFDAFTMEKVSACSLIPIMNCFNSNIIYLTNTIYTNVHLFIMMLQKSTILVFLALAICRESYQ